MEHLERRLADDVAGVGGAEQTHRGGIQELDAGIADDEDAVGRRLHEALILISWRAASESAV